jgi:hypothetical protein
MNVKIEIIPHHRQRYPTVGDWYFDKRGNLTIRVSKLSNWRREMLVAFHELAEVLICKHRKISQASVDRFDKQFERDRSKGKHGEDDEPGDHPKAPYKKEHFFATNVEALLCAELGVDWNKYESEISKLP